MPDLAASTTREKPPGRSERIPVFFSFELEFMTCLASRVKSALIDLNRSATCVPLLHRNVLLAAHIQFPEKKLEARADKQPPSELHGASFPGLIKARKPVTASAPDCQTRAASHSSNDLADRGPGAFKPCFNTGLTRRLPGLLLWSPLWVKVLDKSPVNPGKIDVLSRLFRKPELLDEISHETPPHTYFTLSLYSYI
jgi:hypothetical protein